MQDSVPKPPRGPRSGFFSVNVSYYSFSIFNLTPFEFSSIFSPGTCPVLNPELAGALGHLLPG